MLIACAYTERTRYETLATACRNAWAAVGETVTLFPYADKGSWQKNMLLFTGQAFGHWARGMGTLYVIGADTLPGPAYNGDFKTLIGDADVVCEYRPGRQKNMLIHSGVIGYADTDWGRRIYTTHCMNLAVEAHRESKLNDQEILHDWLAVAETQGAKWKRLPAGFNAKQTHPGAIVIHGHASRGQ